MTWVWLGPAIALGILFYAFMMNAVGTWVQKRWCDADTRSYTACDYNEKGNHPWYMCRESAVMLGIVWPTALAIGLVCGLALTFGVGGKLFYRAGLWRVGTGIGKTFVVVSKSGQKLGSSL